MERAPINDASLKSEMNVCTMHAITTRILIIWKSGRILVRLFLACSCVSSFFMRRLLYGARNGKKPVAATVSTGCFAAFTAALTHALVDFNFQIPASAAYFSVIAATGWAAADRTVSGHK